MKNKTIKLGNTYYITKNGDNVSLSNDVKEDFAAKILSTELVVCGEFPENEDIYFAEKYIDCGKGLYKRHIKIVNYSNKTFSGVVVLNAKINFKPDNVVIPCIFYNGNEFGDGNSPKGFEKDGEPWVFAYDRTSIPSCTLSENKECMFAMFASDYDITSLKSSCSIEKNAAGEFIHKLIYPVNEKPVSYTGKNRFTKSYETYITFYSGTAFEVQSYFFVGTPEYENYGYKNLLERALYLYKNEHMPSMSKDEIEEVSVKNISMGLDAEKPNGLIQVWYTDYTHPIGNGFSGEWDGLTLEMIEKDSSLNKMTLRIIDSGMGFASQGFLQCRMLMKYALKKGDRERFNFVNSFLTGWIQCQLPNGLIQNKYPNKNSDIIDITSLGWGASESIKVYRLLKENNIDGAPYLEFAKKLCSFFVDNYTEERQFGKIWNLDGSCVSYGGSGGGFMLRAIVELYAECGEIKYLECAKKAIEKYYENDLSKFKCSAGAIDCDSIDKESSFPFLYSATELYIQTGNKKYLEYAHKAATYFLSWMFCYDTVYDNECDFSRLGYHTSGGTAISIEHQSIDPYAAVIVPDLIRLSEIDGNRIWADAAQLIWNNCTQCIAGKNGMELHGMKRFPGMQNECFAQARWSKYRSSPEMRGHLNDFIGTWLSSFRLYAIDGMDNKL